MLCMTIPYITTKFKSISNFVMIIWDPTAKFNSWQYFWLYGIVLCARDVFHPVVVGVTVTYNCCVHVPCLF